jgi:hypothetical protein
MYVISVCPNEGRVPSHTNNLGALQYNVASVHLILNISPPILYTQLVQVMFASAMEYHGVNHETNFPEKVCRY